MRVPENSSSRFRNPVDIGERYAMGVGFTPDDDLLAMLINLQDNTGDSFILAFHLISVVLLISANSEILDRHTDPVFPCQFGVGCETGVVS